MAFTIKKMTVYYKIGLGYIKNMKKSHKISLAATILFSILMLCMFTSVKNSMQSLTTENAVTSSSCCPSTSESTSNPCGPTNTTTGKASLGFCILEKLEFSSEIETQSIVKVLIELVDYSFDVKTTYQPKTPLKAIIFSADVKTKESPPTYILRFFNHAPPVS